MKSNLLFLSFFICMSSGSYAQIDFPSLSPKGTLSQQVGNTTISIEYERPSVRNRVIFGGLVPWNKVWRTGAGYCTKISFDKEVIVGGQSVAAGTYSLFTIPSPEEWMVILNSDVSLYGSYDYDPTKDVARFHVPSQRSVRFYESMTLDIDIVPNNAQIYFSWANTQISFPVQTSTDHIIQEYIEKELMTEKSADAAVYASAAAYLLVEDLDFFRASWLVNKSFELEKMEFAYRIQMELMEEVGYMSKAKEAAETGLLFVQQKDFGSESDKQRTIQHWQNEINRLQKLLD
ncbi:MAG: DUF2911 domain-containing protein [Bacteroidota bacterium]